MAERGTQTMKIRPPAAAGLFYAGDARRLQASVSELLGAVKPSAAVVPKALIAPHAGYVYSGRVAAEGFATLRSEEHTSELQSLRHLVCRLLLEKKKNNKRPAHGVFILDYPEEHKQSDCLLSTTLQHHTERL